MFVTELNPNPLSVLQGKLAPDELRGDVSGCPYGVGNDKEMCALTALENATTAARMLRPAILNRKKTVENPKS
jgi:sugar/nucleoside kinase (ribokinase family)